MISKTVTTAVLSLDDVFKQFLFFKGVHLQYSIVNREIIINILVHLFSAKRPTNFGKLLR